MSIQPHPRRLALEHLEDRTVFAGQVWAAVVDGSLIVRGDDSANGVTIDREGAKPGEVRVLVAPGTRLNDEESFYAFFSGITQDIWIRAAGGNDDVVVRGLSVPRDLVFVGEGGHDRLLVDSVHIGQDLRVRSGSGNDVVGAIDSSVLGATRVRAGAGNDRILLDDSALGDTVVAGGDGNDTIYNGSTFRGRPIISGGPGTDVITRSATALSFDFRQGALGWQGGFADYPAGQESFFELAKGIRPLPPELGTGTGFLLKGNNHSDDLFMFLKRKLGPAEGVVAGRTYLVRMTITVGSNAPTGCVGIGGSPGESVVLKAGAVAKEPQAVLDSSDGNLRMNVNKDDLSRPLAAAPVSTIGTGLACEDAPADPDYASLERTHIHEALVTANAAGNLWLLIGTDSGFEGATALYYQRVEVKLVPRGRIVL